VVEVVATAHHSVRLKQARTTRAQASSLALGLRLQHVNALDLRLFAAVGHTGVQLNRKSTYEQRLLPVPFNVATFVSVQF
jgi:hypothetical protein